MASKQKPAEGNSWDGKLASFLDQVIMLSFHLLVLGLPVVICLSANDVVSLPKAVFLWTVTTIVIFTFLASSLLKGQFAFGSATIGLPLLFLFVIVILATLFSVPSGTIIIGNYQRYEGAATFLCYLLLFGMAVRVFNRPKKSGSLLTTVVLTGALLSIYGLLQFFGFEFLPWSKALFEKQRSFATFGNPIYFGAYLSLIFPLALSKYFSSSRRDETVLFGLATTLIIFSLITTYSRAAWLGMVAGLLLFLLFSEWKKWFGSKGLVLMIILGSVAVAVFGGLLERGNAGKDLNFSSRLTSILSPESGFQRIELWKSAVAMIAERPLLGYGPASFRLVGNRFASLKLARTGGGVTLADSPHNYFLQIASNLGVFALLGFFWFFVIWLARAIRQRQKNGSTAETSAGIISGLVGYLLALQFGVSAIGATALFWIIAGILLSYEKEKPVVLYRLKRPLPPGDKTKLAQLVIVLMIAFLPVSEPIRFLRADILFRRAEDSMNISEQVRLYQQAYDLNLYNQLYPLSAGSVYDNLARRMKDARYFQLAESFYLEAERVSPEEIESHYYLGNLYFFAAENFDPYFQARSEAELKKVLEIFPYYLPGRLKMAEFYYRDKRYLKAVNEATVAMQVAPRDEQGYLWASKGLLELGRRKEAKRDLEKVLELNPKNQEAAQLLSALQE